MDIGFNSMMRALRIPLTFIGFKVRFTLYCLLFLSLALIIEELRKDAKAKEEFISEIVPDIMLRLALDKDLRMPLLRTIAGEVATKEDLKGFERSLKEYVDKRIDDLNEGIDDFNRNVRVTLIAILMTLLATIIVPFEGSRAYNIVCYNAARNSSMLT